MDVSETNKEPMFGGLLWNSVEAFCHCSGIGIPVASRSQVSRLAEFMLFVVLQSQEACMRKASPIKKPASKNCLVDSL
jgi:hypothetical protein